MEEAQELLELESLLQDDLLIKVLNARARGARDRSADPGKGQEEIEKNQREY